MQTKIDCSIVENYITEFERMCESYRTRVCDGCPINNKNTPCGYWISKNPKEGIEILQAWSDEHPIEPVVTYLDKLLEIFPNTKVNTKGTPINFCPADIGFNDSENCFTDIDDICCKCWNQPYKGE